MSVVNVYLSHTLTHTADIATRALRVHVRWGGDRGQELQGVRDSSLPVGQTDSGLCRLHPQTRQSSCPIGHRGGGSGEGGGL